MTTTELVSKIQPLIKGDIVFDETTLKNYSHDASLFEVRPQLVIFPKDSQDIEALVKFVSEQKGGNSDISLTARSAGTDMSGGAINDSIILDFSRYFNHIGKIDAVGTEVEPGVFYRDFEKQTLQKNLLLPSYPASRNICALGGMVGNNAGGEKTLSYGKTIDYVGTLKMILSDGHEYEFLSLSPSQLQSKLKQTDFEGQIYRQIFNLIDSHYQLIKAAKPKVSKNSTGYNIWDVAEKFDVNKQGPDNIKFFDLTKLFVGAQGTLGINNKTVVKLVPNLRHHGLLAIYLNDMQTLPHLINDILPTKPESFEAFDDNTLKLAIRFMPQFIQTLGLVGTIKMGLQFIPDLLSFALTGVPKFTLLVEYASDKPQEVSQAIDKLKNIISHYPIKIKLAKTDQQAENFWVIRRESFNLLRKNVKNKHTAPFIDDFIVQPQYLLEFLPKLIAILVKHQIDYTIAGHMGDGNFHIIPLMDFSLQSEKDKIPLVEDQVNQLVFDYHGSISAEHNEGLIRGYYLKRMYGEKMFAIFRQIKKIFDPQDIFNPHKKTDADLNYSLSHIRSHF